MTSFWRCDNTDILEFMDEAFTVSNANTTKVEITVNDSLENVTHWLRITNLSMELKKFEPMLMTV